MFRGAVSLSLFCLLFSSLEGIGSGCVSSLPQSEEDLLKLVQRSSRSSPISLDYKNEVRLFPNISFNCSGSVVGWSLVAPLHSPPPGRRPILNLWSQPNPRRFRQKNNVTMEPCLKEVISQDRQLYLYENTIERPLEFELGDIMGMVLRNQAKAIFKPYVMQRASFTAYHRSGVSAFRTEGLNGFKTDHLVPLVFLHICSKADSDYDKCMTNYRTRSLTCLDLSPSPSVSPVVDSSSGDGGSAVSEAILALALGVALCVTLLVVSLLLALTLIYIGVSRRRKRRRNEEKVTMAVTESTNINGEAQPYAEPLSSRTHTPLPPPPSHPPPPPGLTVQQPIYSVLDGPSPSPPPPYALGLEHSRPPATHSFSSPQYESIDGSGDRKLALVRQTAIQTSTDGEGYARLAECINRVTEETRHY